MMHIKSLFLALLFASLQSAALKCIGPDGSSVDWWFIYRFQGSLEYAYYAPNEATTMDDIFSIRDSIPNTLDDTGSPLQRTLSPLYKSNLVANVAFLAYSEQPPGAGSTKDYAHAKGVVSYNYDGTGNDGFWLIHSQPHWPNFAQQQYNYCTHPLHTLYDECSLETGQSIFCMSYEGEGIMNQIMHQLRVMKVGIYEFKNWIRSTTTRSSQSQLLLFQYNPLRRWDNNGVQRPFRFSDSGSDLTHFAKPQQRPEDRLGIDLYVNTIPDFYNRLFEDEEDIGSDEYEFIVYTYGHLQQNTDKRIGSNHWYIMNVDSLKNGQNNNHGKFGVIRTKNGSPLVVCVGDINRMTSQLKRGGGAICVEDKILGNILINSFVISESQWQPPPRRKSKKTNKQTVKVRTNSKLAAKMIKKSAASKKSSTSKRAKSSATRRMRRPRSSRK